MKYVITESRIKDLIRVRFGIDFTGKIQVINNADELPKVYTVCPGRTIIDRKINEFGPMFLITMSDKVKMLYQKNSVSNKGWIMSNHCTIIDTYYFMDILGIEPLGLTMEQFIKIYL
jgi:hypothetical protein